MITNSMTPTINIKAYLWALGVIQPATPEEIHNFLKFINRSEEDIYDADTISDTIEYSIDNGLIETVSKKNELYVLSLGGGEFLGKKLRLLRDKNRLLLLKSLRNDSFKKEGFPVQEMDGVSPSETQRLSLKAAPRPEESLSPGPLPQNQRFFWPRVSEQLQIGSTSGNPSPSIRLNYYSRNKISNNSNVTTIDSLAELIGISPRLLSSIVKSPEQHYRAFSMQKKSGGLRSINAPRAFLKTIQYWINDYFLYRLKIHNSCLSYRKKVSIRDNAAIHLNKEYVLCIDIDSFFDNISTNGVYTLLMNSGIDKPLSRVISCLTTLNNKLPQGAPSSPLISNAYLYDFDSKIHGLCSGMEICYSRYSDDLTFSCDNKEKLEALIPKIIEYLDKFNLKIKKSKTRIRSKNSNQMITGISVNNGILRPSRKFRKKIRAAFFKAKSNNNIGALSTLTGYLNYLKSFEAGDTEYNISEYQKTIEYLKDLKNSIKA